MTYRDLLQYLLAQDNIGMIDQDIRVMMDTDVILSVCEFDLSKYYVPKRLFLRVEKEI